MESYLIVGAKFRPPARGLLDTLPVGQPLIARREPSNVHDPNAVQVLVKTSAIGPISREMQTACEGYGYGEQELLAQPEWHLGYVPREKAASLAPRLDAQHISELDGQLTFNAAGLALITLEELS